MAQPKSREVSLRLDDSLHKRLVKEAEREDRSVSHIMREACRAYLDAQDMLAGRKKEK